MPFNKILLNDTSDENVMESGDSQINPPVLESEVLKKECKIICFDSHKKLMNINFFLEKKKK